MHPVQEGATARQDAAENQAPEDSPAAPTPAAPTPAAEALVPGVGSDADKVSSVELVLT